MALNVMKPAEGIYTTSEMPKVFTPKGEMTRVFTLHSMGYLHRMKSTGVFTLKGEMPKVFTPRCEMTRVFTLVCTEVFTPCR